MPARLTPHGKVPMSQDASENTIRKRVLIIPVPENLHVDSKELVRSFAEEMARKLKAAEEKYGYSNGWLTQNWEAECHQHLLDHLDKGDPRDVAIYAAFIWARGWSTARRAPEQTVRQED